jgi:hypothetical protein
MGSVQCLIDNDMFKFDVISAISGGTLLLTLIDLSYCYKFTSQKNWYNTYVRIPIYKLTKESVLYTFIKSGFDYEKLSLYLFSLVPEYNRELTTTNTEVICEYNYINANTCKVTNDHSDIIDIKNPVSKKPYWYFIRPLRCTMPFTNLYNIPTYDAGAVANVPVSTVLSKYDVKNIIIIEALPILYIYDSYPSQTINNLLFNGLIQLMSSANNSLNTMLQLNSKDIETKLFCSMSNSLNKSKDKYHKGIFTDYVKQSSVITRFYNGILYNDENLLKIIENEGYIQMYYNLKKIYPKKKMVFKIPNPDVYNENVNTLLKKSIESNLGVEILKSFMNAPFL